MLSLNIFGAMEYVMRECDPSRRHPSLCRRQDMKAQIQRKDSVARIFRAKYFRGLIVTSRYIRKGSFDGIRDTTKRLIFFVHCECLYRPLYLINEFGNIYDCDNCFKTWVVYISSK